VFVPDVIAVPVAAVVGLVVGSFLNVVVWRVPRGESVVRPASRCPACDRPILARDNVPVVSWLLLRRRCRACASPISARYPLVEALTGLVFALVTWRLGTTWELPAFLYLTAVGIALAFIDLDVHRLPNALTLPSYVIGAVLLTVAALMEHEPERLLRAAIGMAALYLLFFGLAVLKSGGMGFGDVKLAGVLGMFAGFLGWTPLAVSAFLAFLFGGVAGVALMVAGSAGRKSKIPFGPYMVAGTIVAVLVGSQIGHAYTSLVVG
jgi:leader peptidase (prepilin peptidase)/N-methyltransferase